MKSVILVVIAYALSILKVSAFTPVRLRQLPVSSMGLRRSCHLKMSSEGPLSSSPEPSTQKNERNDISLSMEGAEEQSQPQPSASAVEVGLKERQAIMAAEAENSPGVLAGKALNFVLVGYIAYLFIDSIRLVVMGASSGPPPV